MNIVIDDRVPPGFVFVGEPGREIPDVVLRVSDGACFEPKIEIDTKKPLVDLETEIIDGNTIRARGRLNAKVVMRRIQ